MWHTKKCKHFLSFHIRSGRWPRIIFMINGQYEIWILIDFSLAQRIWLLFLWCHTVTHSTDLRISPPQKNTLKNIRIFFPADPPPFVLRTQKKNVNSFLNTSLSFYFCDQNLMSYQISETHLWSLREKIAVQQVI